MSITDEQLAKIPALIESCRSDQATLTAIASDLLAEVERLRGELAMLIEVDYPDDDHIEIYVAGYLAARSDYDQIGRSGMDAMERVAVAVQRAVTELIQEGN